MIRKMFALASVALLGLPMLALAAGDRQFAAAPSNTEYCVNKIEKVQSNRGVVRSTAFQSGCQSDMNGRSGREIAMEHRTGHDFNIRNEVMGGGRLDSVSVKAFK